MPTSQDSNTFYGTGRRKSATARVWIFKNQKGISINGKTHAQYFPRPDLQTLVEQPFKELNLGTTFRVRARVQGGGIAGQAGAVRLGISRALVQSEAALRSPLRKAGLMTRDPREKERKKPGRKSARRSFQYTKR
jgi:small subunit ribosomal protein S9